MLFTDLLKAIGVLPAAQRAEAERDLRAARVWRVLLWSPAKRGKSTLLRGTAKHLPAPLRLVSIDSDQTDSENVQRVSLPGFANAASFQAFCLETERALNAGAADIASGKIAGLGIDTLTTIANALKSLTPLATAYNQDQMAMVREKGKQAAVLSSLAAKVMGLHAEAIKSPVDGPILLCVTEHAKEIVDNFVFKGWQPKIQANAGEEILSLHDAVMALSLEPPHNLEPLRFGLVWSGRADVGVRLSEDERPVFAKTLEKRISTGADPERLGVALAQLWDMRKARWVSRWLAPAVEAPAATPAPEVLRLALGKLEATGAAKPAAR